jgi:hypothetical protein
MPLPAICLDCGPLRDQHGSFSRFVLPLAQELVCQNHRYRLMCYVPPTEVGALGTASVQYFTPPASAGQSRRPTTWPCTTSRFYPNFRAAL